MSLLLVIPVLIRNQLDGQVASACRTARESVPQPSFLMRVS